MKLASLEKIESIQPAKNSDNLVSVKLEKLDWPIISKKNTHSEGDVVLYIASDTVVARAPWNEFLFKNENEKNVRIKNVKLRGNPSMGIIIPLKEVITYIPKCIIGDEIGPQLGVSKYEKPIKESIVAKGSLPWFIQKTDEDNLLSNYDLFDDIVNQSVYITKKMDGSSFTAYRYNGEFGVCSRNLELEKTDDNSFWNIAQKLQLDKKLPDGFYIQGELCGPKINGNRLNLTELTLFVFNVVQIIPGKVPGLLFGLFEMEDFCRSLNLKTVPLVSILYGIKESDYDYFKALASEIAYEDKPGEGIVVRPVFPDRNTNSSTGYLSFKIINPNYKE